MVNFTMNSSSCYSLVGNLVEVSSSEGEQGLLYIVHSGCIDGEKAEQARWIASCYVSEKYISKSPLGEENQHCPVKIEVSGKNISLELMRIEEVNTDEDNDEEFEPPITDSRFNEFRIFYLTRINILVNEGHSSRMARRLLRQNIPDRYRHYLTYLEWIWRNR